MKIAIGSDHAGYEYKQAIISMLKDLGHTLKDFGTASNKPVDYPEFIFPVAKAVSNNEFNRGIVLGGSGNGEAITANRVPGIRCALCINEDLARMSRKHNNANIISLGQRMMSLDMALSCVKIWLKTPFDGGRHLKRIKMIDSLL